MDIYALLEDIARNPSCDSAVRLRDFCAENRRTDPSTLRLKWLCSSRADACDLVHDNRAFYELAINQIEAYRKYARKFPTLLEDDFRFIFPSMLAAEQASHEFVADFHASLAKGSRSLLDMTSGLGVDFMAMAASTVGSGAGCVAIDMDRAKALALQSNLRTRGLESAKVVCGESVSEAERMVSDDRRFDLIYVDPARRDVNGGRLFDPNACSPDVIGNADTLFRLAPRILIKNSPMLDVRQALRLFPAICHIYVVGVRNECKEVLVEMRPEVEFEGVSAIDIDAEGRRTAFACTSLEFGQKYMGGYADEKYITDLIDSDECYIYEPSSTVMKLSPWQKLAERFGVIKLSPGCHVFVSGKRIEEFPGRRIKIEAVVDRRRLKSLKGQRRNVVCRNYPVKAEQLASKINLKPSSSDYLYGLSVSPKDTPLLLAGTEE